MRNTKHKTQNTKYIIIDETGGNHVLWDSRNLKTKQP